MDADMRWLIWVFARGTCQLVFFAGLWPKLSFGSILSGIHQLEEGLEVVPHHHQWEIDHLSDQQIPMMIDTEILMLEENHHHHQQG